VKQEQLLPKQEECDPAVRPVAEPEWRKRKALQK
jgi:hypothetical protein